MAAASRLTVLGDSVHERFLTDLPAGPLLVALSGGADSAVCAWAAARTRPGEVRAMFVDHRFPESERLGIAAERIAADLELPFQRVAVDVPAIPSPEAAARSVRHGALEAAASAGEWILTGHTEDDQAETTLGNLIRGAGSAGIAGIPRRRGPWLRPLLAVTRSETRELATLLGLQYRDDPMNSAPEPRRNTLRREVIPDLEARFNPQLRSTLARAARLADDDDAVLESLATLVPIRLAPGMAQIPVAVLSTLDRAVASRAVRRALRHVRGPYAGSASEVQAVLAAAEGAAATIGQSVGVWREGPWVVVSAAGDPAQSGDAVEFSVPGSVAFGVFRVESWVEERVPAPWPIGGRTVVLDADVVGAAPTLRPAFPGERIDIGTGSKNVRDAMSEVGIPRRLRDSWPVLAVGDRLAWIVGVRAGGWARCSPATRRYLWITHEMEER